jgi:hypothetical protein
MHVAEVKTAKAESLSPGITANGAIVQQTSHVLNSEIDGCTRDGLYNLKM